MGWYASRATNGVGGCAPPYASPLLQLGDIPEEIQCMVSPVVDTGHSAVGHESKRRMGGSRTWAIIAEKLGVDRGSDMGTITDEIEVKTIVVMLLRQRQDRLRRTAAHWKAWARRRAAERHVARTATPRSEYILEYLPSCQESVDCCSEIPEDLTHFSFSARAHPRLVHTPRHSGCPLHVCSPLTPLLSTPTHLRVLAAASVLPPAVRGIDCAGPALDEAHPPRQFSPGQASASSVSDSDGERAAHPWIAGNTQKSAVFSPESHPSDAQTEVASAGHGSPPVVHVTSSAESSDKDEQCAARAQKRKPAAHKRPKLPCSSAVSYVVPCFCAIARHHTHRTARQTLVLTPLRAEHPRATSEGTSLQQITSKSYLLSHDLSWRYTPLLTQVGRTCLSFR